MSQSRRRNDSTTTSQGAKTSLGTRILKEVRGYAEALVVAFLVVTFLFTTVGVVGSSMQPTLYGGKDHSHILHSLLVGDRVFIPKYSTWLRRLGLQGPYAHGDIVVLREPKTSPDYLIKKQQGCTETFLINRCQPFFIKRVIGQPGDTVSIHAGQVLVNGTAIDQSFITASGKVHIEPVQFPRIILRDGKPAALEIGFAHVAGINYPVVPTTQQPTGFLPLNDPRVQHYYGMLTGHIVVPDGAPDGTPVLAAFRIPKNRYFVMGDNRNPNGSEDSRFFGAVPANTIAGQATAVIWPPVRDGKLNWRTLAPPNAFQTLDHSSN